MDYLSKNKIKWIKSLRLKKNRDSENVFVVEGNKIVDEVESNWPELIEVRCSTDQTFSNYEQVSDADMKAMSSLKTPSDKLLVVRKPEINKTSTLTLLIDGIQDPGNFGTIIRTADWFGINEIICSKETVDAYNSKVVQSTMGSLFRTQITYCDLVEYIQASDKPTFGALLNGKSMYEYKLPSSANLIIGNEGNGISEALIPFIDNPILIPRHGEAESLNAAIATAVLLAEFKR